jgi:hypothetical protein
MPRFPGPNEDDDDDDCCCLLLKVIFSSSSFSFSLYSSSSSFFNAPPTINERWTLLNLSRMMTNYRRLVLIQGYLSRFFYFALINNDNIQVLNIFSDNQTERKIGFIRRNEIETTSFHSIVETSEKYRILQEIQGSVFYRGTISCLCVFLVE